MRGGTLVFDGTIEDGLRAVLWMRIANRVLLHLISFPVSTAESLYAGIHAIDWREHLTATSTFAIDAVGTTTELRHTHFTALKVKDAIADRLTETLGSRPNVDPKDPDVRLVVRLHGGHAHVSLDLSGYSLHRRGYRKDQGVAPLKETLAAAVVRWSGWDGEEPFVDAMCGSGTFCIEAAMWAMKRAPGLDRDFGFLRWPNYAERLESSWEALCADARESALDKPPGILIANDQDMRAIAATNTNIAAASLEGLICVTRDDADRMEIPEGPGLIVANPPYGQRMGDKREIVRMLRRYGSAFTKYEGYRSVILSADEELPSLIGLELEGRSKLWNGPIECGLYGFSEAL
jgi:putative N6-adenine-specific DNA methylase